MIGGFASKVQSASFGLFAAMLVVACGQVSSSNTGAAAASGASGSGGTDGGGASNGGSTTCLGADCNQGGGGGGVAGAGGSGQGGSGGVGANAGVGGQSGVTGTAGVAGSGNGGFAGDIIGGGTGGIPANCDEIVPVGEARKIHRPMGVTDGPAVVVTAGGGNGQVSVVFMRHDTNGNSTDGDIRVETFDVWGPGWATSELPDGEIVAINAYDRFRAATGNGTAAFALYNGYNPANTDEYSLSLSSPDSLTGELLSSSPTDYFSPVFLAQGNGMYLMAYETLGAVVPRVSMRPLFSSASWALDRGCATSPPTAAATKTVGTDGFNLAYTTSRICCECDDGVDGPLRYVVAEQVAISGLTSWQTEFDFQPMTPAKVTISQHPLGQWVLAQALGEDENHIKGALISPYGEIVVPMFVIPQSNALMAGTFDAATFGDRLVVAAKNHTDSGIALSVLGQDGVPQSGYEFSVQGVMSEGLGVIGSPLGDSFLLYWSQIETTELANAIWVQKFQCSSSW